MTTNVAILAAMLLMLWQTPGCQQLAVIKPGLDETPPATQPATQPTTIKPYDAPIIPKGFEGYGVPEYPSGQWMYGNGMLMVER